MINAAARVRSVASKAAERPGETLARSYGEGSQQAMSAFQQGLSNSGLERDEVRRIFVANFKGGEMSASLLAHFPLAQVISNTNSKDFHVEAAKKMIDQTWPWRHVLRLGPFEDVVAQLREFDPKPFDLIVIDSQDNELNVIKTVLRLLPYAKSNTPIAIMDGVGTAVKNQQPYHRHPTSAWKKLSAYGALRTKGAVAYATPDGAHSFVILKTE